jgi:hypothetical protein
MKKVILSLAACLALSACGGNDYLADVTKDSHSGCFSESSNYLGFTESVTYIHLGDNSAAVNASPSCSGITGTKGETIPDTSSNPVIPATPAPVGKVQK